MCNIEEIEELVQINYNRCLSTSLSNSASLSYQSIFDPHSPINPFFILLSLTLILSVSGNLSYWLLYLFLYLSSFFPLSKANLKSETITALQQLRDSHSQTHIEFERKIAREREMVRHISPLFIFHYSMLLFLRFVYDLLVSTAK